MIARGKTRPGQGRVAAEDRQAGSGARYASAGRISAMSWQVPPP